MNKYPTSFLLSPDAKALLAAAAQKLGIPKTAVWEMAIREFALKHGVEAGPETESGKR